MRHNTCLAVTLSSLVILCGCKDEARIRAQGERIEALESASKETSAELEKARLQLKTVQAERDKVKAEHDKLQARMEEAAELMEAMQKGIADGGQDEDKEVLRRRAPGMELEVVEINGRRFEKVQVRELTATSLTFKHSTGTMSVPLSQLDSELQKKLGYEAGAPAGTITKTAPGTVSAASENWKLEQMDKKITELREKLAVYQQAPAKGISRVWNGTKAGGESPAAADVQDTEEQRLVQELEAELQSALRQRSALTDAQQVSNQGK